MMYGNAIFPFWGVFNVFQKFPGEDKQVVRVRSQIVQDGTSDFLFQIIDIGKQRRNNGRFPPQGFDNH